MIHFSKIFATFNNLKDSAPLVIKRFFLTICYDPKVYFQLSVSLVYYLLRSIQAQSIKAPIVQYRGNRSVELSEAGVLEEQKYFKGFGDLKSEQTSKAKRRHSTLCNSICQCQCQFNMPMSVSIEYVNVNINVNVSQHIFKQ